MIVPRCSLNGLSWRQPRHDHVLVFFKRGGSFRLCFTAHNPGASVYRLKGTSKKPIALSNTSGNLGCLESHCKHLTFQLETSTKARRIDFTFSYTRIYSE